MKIKLTPSSCQIIYHKQIKNVLTFKSIITLDTNTKLLLVNKMPAYDQNEGKIVAKFDEKLLDWAQSFAD